MRKTEFEPEKRAYSKAVWLLGRRDHTRKELFDKLRRDYEEEPARLAVEKLADLGYLDDEETARKLAVYLITRRYFSPKRAVQELVFRGIDRELAQHICEDQEVDIKEQILDLLNGKYANKLADEKSVRRTIANLQRLGYEFGDIKSALNEVVNQEDSL